MCFLIDKSCRQWNRTDFKERVILSMCLQVSAAKAKALVQSSVSILSLQMNATFGLFKLSYLLSGWSPLLLPVSFFFQLISEVWDPPVRKNYTRSGVYPICKLFYLPALAVRRWADPPSSVFLAHLQCFALREQLWTQTDPEPRGGHTDPTKNLTQCNTAL